MVDGLDDAQVMQAGGILIPDAYAVRRGIDDLQDRMRCRRYMDVGCVVAMVLLLIGFVAARKL